MVLRVIRVLSALMLLGANGFAAGVFTGRHIALRDRGRVDQPAARRPRGADLLFTLLLASRWRDGGSV
ncbi:hypothetical protein [Sphingomonas sp. DT-204]|uniref:hypothetical protein n=1 Tax=Sphingomonas sp. DT-204 TaxID=3396166 RepID=UPI003F1C0E66